MNPDCRGFHRPVSARAEAPFWHERWQLVEGREGEGVQPHHIACFSDERLLSFLAFGRVFFQRFTPRAPLFAWANRFGAWVLVPHALSWVPPQTSAGAGSDAGLADPRQRLPPSQQCALQSLGGCAVFLGSGAGASPGGQRHRFSTNPKIQISTWAQISTFLLKQARRLELLPLSPRRRPSHSAGILAWLRASSRSWRYCTDGAAVFESFPAPSSYWSAS